MKLLQKNRKLMIANETKNKLFSIVAHDLRSPINSLKTIYRQMNHALVKKDFNELKKLHQNSYDAVDSTYSFLDNLLHWALAQANQFFYQKESLHLKSILDQVVHNFKFNINIKKLTLNINVSKDLFIYADINTIKIVLRNLIDNAIKYSHQKSTIHVCASIKKATNLCELSIEDFGIGIEEKTLQQLLKTKHIIKGKHSKKVSTGIGIQLCKILLKNNNATLHIHSVKLKGTKIIISLPLTPTNNDKNTNSTY